MKEKSNYLSQSSQRLRVTKQSLISYEIKQLSSVVIKSAIKINKELGPGLLESVYKLCMLIELKKMGIKVQSEVPIQVYYLGEKIPGEGFRMDLLVEDTICS